MRMECNEVLEEEANREGCSDRTVLSIGDFKPSSETSPLLLPPDLDSASAATSAPEPTCGAAATARRLPCLCSSSSLLASTKPRMLLGLATASILLSLAWLSGWTLGFMPPRNRSQRPSSPQPSSTYEFPLDFVWGAATSSYQIEGAASEGGRGSTVWDDFCAQHPSPILDQSSGEVACDHYHRMDSDVDLLASLHFRAYRFSIAWSRILPHGTGSTNPEGIAFYHRLIDALLARNITPWVTMHHWDLPSALPGGWRNRSTIDAFEEYSSVLFDEYGDKIRHWITINEPWTIAVNGYGTGVHAPGHISDTEPYIVGHHLLLAHGTAVREFRRRYGMGRDGHSIGIANCGDYRYPHNVNSLDDREASERAMLFQWGWFVDPIAFGDYPTVMRERLGDRLPRFTSSERNLVLGSASFLGLNYYSSLLASPPETPPTYSGYWADMDANLTADSAWSHNDMGWSVVPDGLREMLMWISRRYGDSRIFVTENGSAEPEPNVAVAVADNRRIDYFRSHLRACAEARNIHKVDLGGYFAWSFLDNFEWQFGYQRRFGICRVDFDTQQRTPKGSAWFLRDVIDSNGRNLATPDEGTTSGRQRQRRALSLDEPPALESRRPLPNRVVVGYGSDAAAVAKAVRNGVNVVIWSFLDFRSTPLGGSTVESGAVHERRDRLAGTVRPVLKTNLNLTAVRATIEELDATGYNDTVHLFSVGGWNGPHLDPTLSSIEWYHAFKDTVGHLFHGIDWDLEGNDDLDSPYNIFTLECLDKIGAISQMAKSDGYLVGMAPPQSYLDLVQGNTRFSRLVNLTDPNREWHNEFSYFGANVYAYLLKRYEDSIDLVFMQFYESYSRASMTIHNEHLTAAAYLERYLEGIDGDEVVGMVNFSDDPDVELNDSIVRIPLSKLVLGLANGWADKHDEKTLYICPEQVAKAWDSLKAKGTIPRGAGFWTIDEEGSNGVYLAKELSKILGNRD